MSHTRTVALPSHRRRLVSRIPTAPDRKAAAACTAAAASVVAEAVVAEAAGKLAGHMCSMVGTAWAAAALVGAGVGIAGAAAPAAVACTRSVAVVVAAC